MKLRLGLGLRLRLGLNQDMDMKLGLGLVDPKLYFSNLMTDLGWKAQVEVISPCHLICLRILFPYVFLVGDTLWRRPVHHYTYLKSIKTPQQHKASHFPFISFLSRSNIYPQTVNLNIKPIKSSHQSENEVVHLSPVKGGRHH